jgi:Ca-activated chloride channel family protein
MRNKLAAVALAILLAGPLPALAQAPDDPAGHFTASVSTEYVQIPVVVRDRKGRFVDNLSKKDFHIWVEGRPVAVESFVRDLRAPVSFAVLLDVSGSMRIADKLEQAKEAIRKLVELRHPGDDFALFTFSEDEVRVVQNFSRDPAPMLRQLLFLEPRGKTALFDAVIQTANELLAGRNTKKAILLFTDGVDNASDFTQEDLERVMQNEGVPVYAIGMKNAAFDVLSQEQRKELSVAALDLVASSSGGKMFLVSGGEDLRPIAQAIEIELRRQYVLGFEPAGEGDVKYRPIVVTVTGGGNRVVRARRGYRGSPPRTVEANP